MKMQKGEFFPGGGIEMYKLDSFMADLERRNPAEPEFIQAVREVIE